MPTLTTLALATGGVAAWTWLVHDGREDDPQNPPPAWSSFANLRRHINKTHARQAEQELEELERDADTLDSLAPEVFPSYERITKRSRSLHILAERKSRLQAEMSSTGLPSSSRSSIRASIRDEPEAASTEFPRPRSLRPAVNRPSTSSTTAGERQPSLTLSDASRLSSTASNPGNTTAIARSSSYPLTPEQSKVLLPPTSDAGVRILDPQTRNDASDAEADVVESWLGTMDESGLVGLRVAACGAKGCSGGVSGARCACVEDGKTSIRGRRMEYC